MLDDPLYFFQCIKPLKTVNALLGSDKTQLQDLPVDECELGQSVNQLIEVLSGDPEQLGPFDGLHVFAGGRLFNQAGQGSSESSFESEEPGCFNPFFVDGKEPDAAFVYKVIVLAYVAITQQKFVALRFHLLKVGADQFQGGIADTCSAFNISF